MKLTDEYLIREYNRRELEAMANERKDGPGIGFDDLEEFRAPISTWGWTCAVVIGVLIGYCSRV